MIRLIVLSIYLITSIPGTGQKKQLRQAEALEATEAYGAAMEMYKDILYKNAHHFEAKKGLQRTAQKIIDQQLSSYFITRNSGEWKEAVAAFEKLLYFQKELQYFNVSVTIPAYYFVDFEADKTKIALEKEAKDDTQLEEKYQSGLEYFSQEEWIAAWNLLSEIRGYKDTHSVLEKIKERATTVSIVIGNTNRFSNEKVLLNHFLSELVKCNNPLIRIVDRENTDQLIAEQKLGLSGLLDEQTVAALGRILGVEMLLLTNVLNYHFVEGNKISQRKTAYIATVDHTIKNYYPVDYQEVRQQRRLDVSFQYQLINVSTAEVLAADIIYDSYEDTIHYAEYDSDPNTLYPSNGTRIYTKGEELESFHLLFSNPRNPASQKEMDMEVQQSLAKKVAKSIDSYFRNK